MSERAIFWTFALCVFIVLAFINEQTADHKDDDYKTPPKDNNAYRAKRQAEYEAWRKEYDRLQQEKKDREERRKRDAEEKIKKAREDFAVVDSMTGYAFERYCASLLEKSGFSDVRVTRQSGDHGVDIVAMKDGEKYAVQCKRHKKPVGFKAVTEIFTGKAIYEADRAIIITTSTFTEQAIADANKIGVELWNRNDLIKISEAIHESN